MREEKKIKRSADPVNISNTRRILNQMINCICKIKIRSANGTGFFCRIPLDQNNNIICLLTNYHVLNEEYLIKNKEIHILLNDDKEAKKIDLNIKRIIYYYKECDITIIELKEEDNIKEYLELDDNIFKDNEKIFYEEKSIYVIQYLNGDEACVSYGILNKINKNDILHICSTDKGSSGSPILNLKNNKVIGIHRGSPDHAKNYNCGTLLKYPLIDFINKNKRNLFNIKESTKTKQINIHVNQEKIGISQKKEYIPYSCIPQLETNDYSFPINQVQR